MVELGQIGRAVSASGAAADFFVHSQQGSTFGDAAPLHDAFSAAASAVADMQVLSSLHAKLAASPSLNLAKWQRTTLGYIGFLC